MKLIKKIEMKFNTYKTKLKSYFLFALIFFMLAFSACNSDSKKESKSMFVNETFSDTGITKLPNNQVCMVNNRFMNSVQIAVPLNNKTYYGCCEGCVKALKEDSTTHYIPDPLSGEQVDKAIAFIIGKPGSKEDVLFFKTETNAREYFKKNIQKNK